MLLRVVGLLSFCASFCFAHPYCETRIAAESDATTRVLTFASATAMHECFARAGAYRATRKVLDDDATAAAIARSRDVRRYEFLGSELKAFYAQWLGFREGLAMYNGLPREWGFWWWSFAEELQGLSLLHDTRYLIFVED